MLEMVTPESVGVSSADVKQLIEFLNKNHVAPHSLLLARGNRIFAEAYWHPYKKNTMHRMYSITKSFVGIAVCELIARGKIKPTDKIVDYFSDKLPEDVPKELKDQTIEDMLTMKTCMWGIYWFGKGVRDRLSYYFHYKPARLPGESYYYDSDASFVLGCLVERVTNKKLLDFLKEICLDDIGFSKDACMLSCVSDYPWGDSGLICRPEDILRFARLLANGGAWEGNQLLHKEAVAYALSMHTETVSEDQDIYRHGYGCQIWKNAKGGFSFCGMHSQFMHYDPQTDIIFVCTAGNKGGNAGQMIYDGVQQFVFNRAADSLPENETRQKQLSAYTQEQTLLSVSGGAFSPAERRIDGVKIPLDENVMGIKWVQTNFHEESICFSYKNAQGEKAIPCGRGYNVFGVFPQQGYSDSVGGIGCEGNMYQCAASAAWQTDDLLHIKVQIIDKYIGILDIFIHYEGESVSVVMEKTAEDFLGEYNGKAEGKIEKVK